MAVYRFRLSGHDDAWMQRQLAQGQTARQVVERLILIAARPAAVDTAAIQRARDEGFAAGGASREKALDAERARVDALRRQAHHDRQAADHARRRACAEREQLHHDRAAVEHALDDAWHLLLNRLDAVVGEAYRCGAADASAAVGREIVRERLQAMAARIDEEAATVLLKRVLH